MGHPARITIAVQLHDDRLSEPHEAGTITVDGDYDMTDEDALSIALASPHLDLDAPGGMVRWRGDMVPREHFVKLTASIVAKGRADPESIAAKDDAELAERKLAEADRIAAKAAARAAEDDATCKRLRAEAAALAKPTAKR